MSAEYLHKISKLAEDFHALSTTPGLSEKAYLIVKAALERKILLPGMRLTEAELGNAINIGRTPLRESLIRLKNEGFLVHDEHSGLSVRRLSHQDIVDLYQTRTVLEAAAARFAAQRASAAETELLSSILQSQKNELTGNADLQALSLINQKFHRTILMAARNSFLIQCFERISYALILTGRTVYSEKDLLKNIYAEHEAIVEAIRKKDADAASEAITIHLTNAENYRLNAMINDDVF